METLKKNYFWTVSEIFDQIILQNVRFTLSCSKIVFFLTKFMTLKESYDEYHH